MSEPTSVVFLNARFIDPSTEPILRGDAMLARDGRIVAVGQGRQVLSQAPQGAKRIDLHGCIAIPGLVDAHMHLEDFGRSMSECDLRGTRNRQEAVDRVRAWAQGHPELRCIRGGGYSINDWDDPRRPSAQDLDSAVRDRACVLNSMDGHGAWANTAAMRVAGVSELSSESPGGGIVRDESGRPTGYFLETAIGVIQAALPKADEREIDVGLGRGIEEMSRRGHTGAHIPANPDGIDLVGLLKRIDRLYPQNTCPLRLRFFAPFEMMDQVLEAKRRTAPADRVLAAGIKVYADGSLGSQTAWLSEPFLGGGSDTRTSTIEMRELRHRIEVANAAGLPLICHAIGDRACEEVLRTFCQADRRGVANRVEHAQIIRPETVAMLARAGVAASVQPAHLWTDWAALERLLGAQRAAWCFPLRQILDSGAILAIGSDAPVVPPDPAASLHAAVVRTDDRGQPHGGWHPEHRITPREWAVGSTRDAWQSIGEDRGRLVPAMDCDLTLLREDIFAPEFRGYLLMRAEGTVIAGQPRFVD